MEKTAQQILTEAADYLEREGAWGQRNYFRFKKNLSSSDSSPACVMCAHGAIAYCGSPAVKEQILSGKVVDFFTRAASPVLACAAALTAAAERKGFSVLEYIRKYPQHYGNNSELAYAHYLAAKAGLTFDFNDTLGRTKQEVIVKLREAALST